MLDEEFVGAIKTRLDKLAETIYHDPLHGPASGIIELARIISDILDQLAVSSAIEKHIGLDDSMLEEDRP